MAVVSKTTGHKENMSELPNSQLQIKILQNKTFHLKLQILLLAAIP